MQLKRTKDLLQLFILFIILQCQPLLYILNPSINSLINYRCCVFTPFLSILCYYYLLITILFGFLVSESNKTKYSAPLKEKVEKKNTQRNNEKKIVSLCMGQNDSAASIDSGCFPPFVSIIHYLFLQALFNSNPFSSSFFPPL